MTAEAKKVAVISVVVLMLGGAVVAGISANAPTPSVTPVENDGSNGMNGQDPSATPGGGAAAGEALIDERCTVCHGRDRIDAAAFDEAGWQNTVERMVRYGAKLTSAEQATLIEYLATR